MRAQDDKKKCKKPTCKSDELTTEDGICEKCPLYHNSVENYTKCKKPNCLKNEIIRENGTCDKCEMYSVPNDKKTKCVVDP